METWKIKQILILIGYTIPWAFLALYGDKELHTSLFYVLIFLFSLILGLLCRKTRCFKLSIAGNLLSFLLSLLCTLTRTDWEDWYFIPFGIAGWVIVLSLFSWMVQFVIWNYKREMGPARALLVAVCTATLLLVAFIFLLLIFSAF